MAARQVFIVPIDAEMLLSPAMHVAALDYDLPDSLIAQRPLERRDDSRLLVLNRGDQSIREDVFANIGEYMDAGDCLVLNDTRVIRARLKGKKSTGGQVEIFLLKERKRGSWEALVRPGTRVKPGSILQLNGSVTAEVGDELRPGVREVSFDPVKIVDKLEAIGEVPLPPYIHRDERVELDAVRYQTVYAARPGAVAAPTAGLHFTETLLESLDAKGVERVSLTLHVGYGTFKPVHTARFEEHKLEPEDFDFPDATARRLNEARKTGRRIIAVGTTAARVLETQYRDGAFHGGSGKTTCYIYPPYPVRALDGLLTNFHLPRSTLLALVCAFGGTEFVLSAYRDAVEKRFRFYSYGDAMLIV